MVLSLESQFFGVALVDNRIWCFMFEQVHLNPSVETKEVSSGRLVFFFFSIWLERNSKIFIWIERSSEELWEAIRSNNSILMSVNVIFVIISLGLLFCFGF